MKVLQIANGYLDKPLYKNLFTSLSKLGVDSTIFVPVQKGKYRNLTNDDGVIVSECFTELDRYLFFTKQYKILNQTRKIGFEELDIVHAHTLFSTGYTAFQIKKRKDIPYIVAVRNTDVNLFFKKMPWLRNLGVRVMVEAEYIVFLSQSYADYVINHYVPKQYKSIILDKIRILPNGIDSYFIDHKINRKEQKDDFLRIIQIGDIDDNKNVEMTLNAVKKFNKVRKTRLTVVGEIKEERFKKVFFDNNDVVNYIPKQGKENIVKLLRKSDILCVPSHKETFGLVYAEAMSQGVPVIYTKGQGFDGQFENGIIGYAVDENDVEQIIEAFTLISANFTKISMNCINNCDRYSWDNIAEQYQKLYHSIKK